MSQSDNNEPDFNEATEEDLQEFLKPSKLAPLFSSGKDDWQTPHDFFKKYDDIYHFILDAAADSGNHKCDAWLGPDGEAEDALAVDWLPYLKKGNIWLNPPYSRKLQKEFVLKAQRVARAQDTRDTCNQVVCLLPARTDTKLFHEVIQPWGAIDFIKGRIKFVGAEHGAPFPSMIVVF